MLGFGEVGSKSGDLILAQTVLCRVVLVFVRGSWRHGFGFAERIRRNRRRGFGPAFGEEPSRQSAGKAARHSGARSA